MCVDLARVYHLYAYRAIIHESSLNYENLFRNTFNNRIPTFIGHVTSEIRMESRYGEVRSMREQANGEIMK